MAFTWSADLDLGWGFCRIRLGRILAHFSTKERAFTIRSKHFCQFAYERLSFPATWKHKQVLSPVHNVLYTSSMLATKNAVSSTAPHWKSPLDIFAKLGSARVVEPFCVSLTCSVSSAAAEPFCVTDMFCLINTIWLTFLSAGFISDRFTIFICY